MLGSITFLSFYSPYILQWWSKLKEVAGIWYLSQGYTRKNCLGEIIHKVILHQLTIRWQFRCALQTHKKCLFGVDILHNFNGWIDLFGEIWLLFSGNEFLFKARLCYVFGRSSYRGFTYLRTCKLLICNPSYFVNKFIYHDLFIQQTQTKNAV